MSINLTKADLDEKPTGSLGYCIGYIDGVLNRDITDSEKISEIESFLKYVNSLLGIKK